MTMVMQTISKSQLKSQLLEYLRKVEKDKKPLIVTHAGKPVIEVAPYKEKGEDILESLRGTLIFYKDPDKPVAEDDWEVLK